MEKNTLLKDQYHYNDLVNTEVFIIVTNRQHVYSSVYI